MFWRNIAAIALMGAQVVGRAFRRALQEELATSRQTAQRAGGGSAGRKTAKSDTLHGMSLSEAQKILNIPTLNEKETILKNYQHLFEVNSKSKGGSLYLQSKVVRAKERIDEEFKNQSTDGLGEQSKLEEGVNTTEGDTHEARTKKNDSS